MLTALCFACGGKAHAQTGPFSPEDWPGSKQAGKRVHYFVSDGGLTAPSDTWQESLAVLSGGDQVTEDVAIGGHSGKKVLGSYLNIADDLFEAWAETETIDILVQAYGDGGLYSAAGQPRNFNFLTGVLPELAAPVGGQVPLEARNKKWNWILFRIPNGVRGSDGKRLVGSGPTTGGGAGKGGVNGGTIRFEAVPNLIVRVVAFGEEGAFGSLEDVNRFAPAERCDPEPAANLAGIDIHAGLTNHIEVLNNGDQQVVAETSVGPAGDRRRAIRPAGPFLNFGITEQFLGKACNDARAVKICVEFYDDPAFQGSNVALGPEAYATDETTGIGVVPADRRHVMQGTGLWIRRSWIVSAVNLRGVNAAPLTAGPRLVSENGSVAVSSFQIAVLRVGDHPLAGQDPLSGCFEDPLVCTELYGSYAELDLAKDLRDGLDVGTSGGDQNMVTAEAGPAGDRRLAVRAALDDGTPGFRHQYLNFAILNQALGPNSQPNAHLAICATYFDDPELTGASFRPEAYRTDRNGTETFGFAPASGAVVLEGTGRWREAYFEVPDVKFSGVNQGPQAAARFLSTGKIFISRIRYAVIRPCGPNAGKNALAECKPAEGVQLGVGVTSDRRIRLSWPDAATGFVLQTAFLLSGPWTLVTEVPVVEGVDRVLLVVPDAPRFYRLFKP